MEEQTHLSPKESLGLIREMIGRTRENIRQHSFIFLLWGWLLALASLFRFLLQTQTGFKYYFLPFPVLAAAGVITTAIYFRRKTETTETHLNYFINRLWIGLGIAFVAAVFVSVYQGIEPFTYTLILAGTGTLVSGVLMRFRPLQLGAVCFLAAAIACVFVPDEYKVLVHGIAIIFGYLVPGYLLKHSVN